MNKEKCSISAKPHDVLSVIYEVSGDCGETIKTINEKQGTYSRKAFNRRLVYVDDSVESRANASKEK